MGLFSKKETKPEIKSSLNEEKELNLFSDDIHSDAFLEKVGELNDVNKKFQKGLNLLHFACEYHDVRLARELLGRKINIDEKNIYGTPLCGPRYSIPGVTMKWLSC